MRLKKPKPRFIIAEYQKISQRISMVELKMKNLMLIIETRTAKSVEMNAKTKFAKGPAAETKARSLLGFLKFLVITGTGFAQPNPTKAIISAPRGSIWSRGFS